MSANDAVIELLSETLEREGTFKAQRMFSGHGLYLDGLFFAILIGGILYFKTSDETRPRFEAEGMAPFGYDTRTGRRVLTSHWRVPEWLYDEPDEMLLWARAAVAAARAKKQVTAKRAASMASKAGKKTAPKTKPRARGARSKP